MRKNSSGTIWRRHTSRFREMKPTGSTSGIHGDPESDPRNKQDERREKVQSEPADASPELCSSVWGQNPSRQPPTLIHRAKEKLLLSAAAAKRQQTHKSQMNPDAQMSSPSLP